MLSDFNMARLAEYSVDQLLVALINLKISRFGRLEIVCKYGASKFSESPLNYEETAIKLKNRYQLDFCYFGGDRIWATVSKFETKDVDTLLAQIYSELAARSKDANFVNELRECLPVALYGLRGSADFTVKKCSVDINHDSQMQRTRIQSLLSIFTDLDEATRFNPSRGTRSPQFRTDLSWMKATCIEDIAALNSYKASILVKKGLI